MSIARSSTVSRAATFAALAAALFAASPALAADYEHTTGSFAGTKANRGTDTHRVEGDRYVLAEARLEAPMSTRPAVQARAAPKQARSAGGDAGTTAVYASTSRAIDRVYGH